MDIDFDYTHKDFVFKRPKLIIELVSWITPVMNRIHNLNHDEEFWLAILRDHLKICVNRMHLLKKPGFKPKAHFYPINSFEEPRRVNIYRHNLTLIVKSLKQLLKFNKENWEKINEHKNICLGSRANEIAKEVNGVVFNELYPMLYLSDSKARRRLKHETDAVDDIFLKNVLLTTPRINIEYFKRLYNAIENLNVEGKIFHVEHSQSFFSDLLLAKFRALGAKLYSYQKGCGFGETDYYPDETEYRVIDKYITFGWQRHPKDEQGKAPRLAAFARLYETYKKKYSGKYDYDAVVIYSIMNDRTKPHYVDFTNYLLQHLDRDKFSRLLFRARPFFKMFNHTKRQLRFLKLPHDVEIDDAKRSMAEITALTKVNILAFTMATNLYECIYAEHPVVAYNMMELPSNRFEYYLNFFKEVGVLHDEYKSLVDHLNSIDIQVWWNNVVTRKEFKDFQQEFAGKIN